MIDVGKLTTIGEYFRFRWDPPILAELAQQPSRFRALASRVEAQLGEHLDDNAMARSLARLTRRGLITADSDPAGRRNIKVYRLTTKGLERVATYRILAGVLASHTATGHDDAAGIHRPHTTQPPG